MILRRDTTPLIFNGGLVLNFAEVVEFILTLPLVFKVVKPILATFVVRAPAVLNICRKVCCVLGNIYLPVQSLLFINELLESVLHHEFLLAPLLHHKFFLELTRRLNCGRPILHFFDCQLFGREVAET